MRASLGTFFGCLLVVLLVRFGAAEFVEAVFLVSVGLAHAFVNVRYWVTATAATVMALLQSHLADPVAGYAIGERLADTVLGAALGWGFSYVLPSWERLSLPQTLAQALAALGTYARCVLAAAPGAAVEQRLARRNAYDALGAVAAAAQRSAVEPKNKRLPVEEMSTFLDHGQRLMAHLSSLRLMLRRAAPCAPPAAAARSPAPRRNIPRGPPRAWGRRPLPRRRACGRGGARRLAFPPSPAAAPAALPLGPGADARQGRAAAPAAAAPGAPLRGALAGPPPDLDRSP